MGHKEGKCTSKSCRFKISSSGGLFEMRSWRAFSSSVIVTSTFSTVSGCTGPKLQREFNTSILNSNKFRSLLLLGGQICGDGVRWVNWFIFLSAEINRPRVHKVLAVRLTSRPFQHI